MNAFAAETLAWRLKALGEDIAGDARAMALDVKRGDASELRRRALAIRRLAFAAEKAAGEFLNALEPEPVS